MLSACLLEGDIDQIRPRPKTEAEKPKDPYADYRLLGPDDLTFNAGLGQIIAYKGPVPVGNVRIPAEINGQPVTSIGNYAFRSNQLTSVTIPDRVTSIGYAAFSANQVTSVTFKGNEVIMFNDSFGLNLDTLYISPPPVGGAGTYTRPDAISTAWTKVN